VRLRHVCIVGTALLIAGVTASDALADTTPSGTTVGGATAPVNTAPTGASGPTGTTGVAGSTALTGTSGGAGTTGTGATVTPGLTSPLAPIVLAKGQPPNLTYTGPVFVQTSTGALTPYVPQTMVASVSGGTIAGTPTSGSPHLVVPGATAEIVHGIAAAPEQAPLVVQRIIWAANRIIGRPYVFGGGHRSFISSGYDCSGTVSFALHGGSLLRSPLDSSQFENWGQRGQGQWMTILTNPGHAYLDVAGLRLDTSSADDPSNQQGPRWRPLRPGNPGYVLRHPLGL
jgi:cell wall-associated NlpC family hydrolase